MLTNPKTQRLPFDLKTIKISWAKALDYRPNEPTSYDLNDAELDELKARLADLKIGRKDKELGGFTPVYSISYKPTDITSRYKALIPTEGHCTELPREYYRINDKNFSIYLRNICAKGTRTNANIVRSYKSGLIIIKTI